LPFIHVPCHLAAAGRFLKQCLLTICFVFAIPVHAASDLQSVISALDSFTATFEQTLYGADSEALQTTRGKVALKRPGRFNWQYTEPATQEIIADGSRIWLYDKELEQVTVNEIDDRIAGTPLVLLMGTAPLSDAFSVKPVGESDSIDWFELTPKGGDSDFELVFIGLSGESLAAMELRDNFGQATQIIFSDFVPNPDLDDSVFVFSAPEGVDIIGLDE